MNESNYQAVADSALARIERAFSEVDVEDVDCERGGDVLTLTFGNGKRCVLNTQRPTRQIWLAANARAWHFSYDEEKKVWLDDKQRGIELFSTLSQIVEEASGIKVTYDNE